MRKTTIIFLFLLVAGGAVLGVLFYAPTIGHGGTVRALAEAFMKDVRYKDFRSSSTYTHRLERDRVDIGHAIEKLFLVKPEMLDIIDFSLVRTEVDGNRARVNVRTNYKKLNYDKKVQEGEIVLYFIKRHPDCPSGATCREDGVCVNEFGRAAKRLEKVEDDKDKKKKKLRDVAAVAEGDTYKCGPSLEPQWYLNIDSTLKEKKYNN